jgi:aryl-alcohol dehydrogenase-like predicted oxidoreductase
VRHRRFDPLARDLSVLVLGTAAFNPATEESARELLDAWVELGGNVVDCAREYGELAWGESEQVLGRWLADRRADDLVVLTKGAHHRQEGERRVTPGEITRDLMASLAALQVEAVDLYLLHRDDPSEPVGEILECLNDHARAGHIRAFGGSNWTTVRLEEVAAHAEANGLEPFSCASPGLSLAVQEEPPWWECVAAHDRESVAWYERTQLPVFAWSALAGGFFARVQDPEVERIYGSEANRERLRRAEDLGRKKGATPAQVALAWVLHQPFPTYAIIGPRSVEELRASVAALDVELTPAEVRWLDLEEEAWG